MAESGFLVKFDQKRIMENKENLGWIWAYAEQLYLYYKHDAFWIECARKRWKEDGEGELEKFLKAYTLKRGEIGHSLKTKGLAGLIEIFNEEYSKPLEGNVFKHAQTQWKKVIRRIKNRYKIRVTPASLALKAYWLYHPAKLPMYDQYVLNGLSKEMAGENITESNYLLKFDEYYKRVKKQVERISEDYFQNKYKFFPRVVDKYLWLKGLGNKKDDKLEKFEFGMQRISKH